MDCAVLLMAYGGPDSLADVEPYLLDVRGGRETPPALVEEIRERYARIGGRSPLLEITRDQAAALETELNRQPGSEDRFRVFVGMRHWKPTILEAVQEIRSAGFEHLITLCMTPFASKMSTGAYAEKLRAALEAADPDGLIQTRNVEFWFGHPRYIRAMKDLIQAAITQFPVDARSSVPVIFTAHSLPAAIMQQGDPYDAQFKRAAALVAGAAGIPIDRWIAGYQSAGAQNGRWLGPSLEEMLRSLAGAGEKYTLIAPIGFVSDHVEILYDIDIEARRLAETLGMRVERIAAPNTFPPFIEALADVVLRTVHNEPALNGNN